MLRTPPRPLALLAALLALVVLRPSRAHAQDRHPVAFEITTTTNFGDSIFVLGDLPELGANVVANAVKMLPSNCAGSTCTWRITISLPADRTYTFRYWRRGDAPGRATYPDGGAAVAGPFTASTPSSPPPAPPTAKTLFLHSTLPAPTLMWRFSGSTEAFQARRLTRFGPGRTAGETRWFTSFFAAPRRGIEFFFTGHAGAGRDPAGSATYTTTLDAGFIQDGRVFTYVPAASVAAGFRDYNFSPQPSLFSTNLNQTRFYRVWLPRGFHQQPARRYPVLYLHDGQNVFESGPFGTWQADLTAGSLIERGEMREVVLVAADHGGSTRLPDYSATENGFGARGEAYLRFLRDELRPVILNRYPGRIIDDPAQTGTLGSSMGGQISLLAGWDFAATFAARIGAFSGAFQISGSGLPSSVFYNRVLAQPRRAIRLYLDSGDSGTANDNYTPILGLRDNLVNPGRAANVGGAYATEGDLRYVVGEGDIHNEDAWRRRLPDAYRFLFPAAEDQAPLLAVFNPAFDRTADARVTVDDLYAASMAPADVNLDGQTTAADADAIAQFLRREEPADASAQR